MMLFLGAGGPLDSLEQHCDEGKGPKSSRMTRSSPKPSEAFRTVERSEVRFAENGLSFQKQLQYFLSDCTHQNMWQSLVMRADHQSSRIMQEEPGGMTAVAGTNRVRSSQLIIPTVYMSNSISRSLYAIIIAIELMVLNGRINYWRSSNIRSVLLVW
jgi:hypothetical protein